MPTQFSEFVFGIAGLAPLASHFSVSSNRKVTKRMPPRQLRPRQLLLHCSNTAHPCAYKKQGFPFSQHCYHAAPELAHVEKHVRSDNWHRKHMITALAKWLAEVEGRPKSKTRDSDMFASNVTIPEGYHLPGIYFS